MPSGSKTVWIGEAGAGSRLKLVVNDWIVGLLGVLAETVAFSKTIGVDPLERPETIEGGPLGLPYAQLKGNMMIEEDFPTSFSARLARKDAGLVLGSAEAHDLQMPVAEAVAGRFDEAIEAGHGDEDMATVYGRRRYNPAATYRGDQRVAQPEEITWEFRKTTPV